MLSQYHAVLMACYGASARSYISVVSQSVPKRWLTSLGPILLAAYIKAVVTKV